MQYIFAWKTNKGKSLCNVTDFTCILLENQKEADMCVPVSLNFGCRKNLSAQRLSFVFVVLDIIRYIEWLKTDTQKRLCQSLEKKALSIVLNPFISAYDSTAQDLAARIYQNEHFQTKNENSMTQRLFTGTIAP